MKLRRRSGRRTALAVLLLGAGVALVVNGVMHGATSPDDHRQFDIVAGCLLAAAAPVALRIRWPRP